MKARNRFFVILAVLTVVAAIWYFATTNRSSDLVLVGTVDANQVIVSARVGGRIDKLLVDEGTPVKQGDLIAQLDPSELQAEVDAAQATINSLRSRVGEASATEQQTKGQTSSDVANAAAAVQSARAQLIEAQADQERIRSDT